MPGEPGDPGGGIGDEEYLSVGDDLVVSEQADAPAADVDPLSPSEQSQVLEGLSASEDASISEPTPSVTEDAGATDGPSTTEQSSTSDAAPVTDDLAAVEQASVSDDAGASEPLGTTEDAQVFDTIGVSDSASPTEGSSTTIPIGDVSLADSLSADEQAEVLEPSVFYTTDGIEVEVIPIPWHAVVRIRWTVTPADPEGTLYQVYQNGRLVEETADFDVTLPWPQDDAWFRVVRPLAAYQGRPLPIADAPPGSGGTRRVRLTWLGGNYLDPADPPTEYRIYRGTTPGGAVSYASPVGVVAASSTGRGGWGQGGWGQGGWGTGATAFGYTDLVPRNGTWNYAVRAVDAKGNESTAATASAVVAANPRPGGPVGDGYARLARTYDPGTRVATLSWNASPDA